MAKKYPRFDSVWKKYDWKKVPNPPPCELCGTDAVGRIHMQVDYMRGNDEDFKVCGEHLALAKSDGVAFYKAYFENQEKANDDEQQEPVA